MNKFKQFVVDAKIMKDESDKKRTLQFIAAGAAAVVGTVVAIKLIDGQLNESNDTNDE